MKAKKSKVYFVGIVRGKFFKTTLISLDRPPGATCAAAWRTSYIRGHAAHYAVAKKKNNNKQK